jgi:hypothetical protein
MSTLLAWHPWPGLFIAILGFVAVVVPLFRDLTKIGKAERAMWTVVVFVLLCLEVRSLKLQAQDFEQDRSEVIATAQNIVDLQKRVSSVGDQLRSLRQETPSSASSRKGDDAKWRALMESYDQLKHDVDSIVLSQNTTGAKPRDKESSTTPSNIELKRNAALMLAQAQRAGYRYMDDEHFIDSQSKQKIRNAKDAQEADQAAVEYNRNKAELFKRTAADAIKVRDNAKALLSDILPRLAESPKDPSPLDSPIDGQYQVRVAEYVDKLSKSLPDK